MLTYRIRNRNHPDYDRKKSNAVAGQFPVLMVSRKGHHYAIGDEQVELFTIEVLAEALDRKRVTIIEWEKKKLFPKPVFSLTHGERRRRLYSGVQVLNLHELMWNKYQARKSNTTDLASFFADAKRVFYARFLCVDEHGNINLHQAGIK
jgi:hypothetical protein